MSKQETKKSYKDILGKKEYMKILVATFINRFGDSIDAIAFTWLVYQLTENAAWSALIFGLNKLPTIFVTPFAGAWVEGKNKKAIMVWTDLIRGLCVAVIAMTYGIGILKPWMLFAMTILISTAEAFRLPAGTALTPKVLDPEYLEIGMSLNSSIGGVVEIIGTAIAGGIIAKIGIPCAIYIDMTTFLLSAIIIMMVHSKESQLQNRRFEGKEYMKSLREGISYVRKSSTFMFFIAVCLLLNGLLTPINSLQAPLTSEVLHAGAGMLSVLSIACTVGSILGSFSYPWMKRWLNQRKLFAICGFGISAYYVGLIACGSLYENIIFSNVYVGTTSALMGCFVAWLSMFMNVEFIKKVNEEYLARASGILTAANVAAMPVMSFVISGIIGFVGTKAIFMGVGIIAAIICMFMVRSKELSEEDVAKGGILTETVG